MDISLTDYELGDRLHDGRRSLVYRARRKHDGASVVIKIQQSDHPSLDELARFRREYQIAKGLTIAGAVQPLALARYKNRLALVMEDTGGESLRAYLVGKKLPIADVLSIGSQIASALGELHARRVVHKDVNPGNVVWNPATHEARLIDFGISTTLSRESPSAVDPNVLEGTLGYMSPEQTGRMNRAVDYRTDFYSLGVTLYEMLAGRLPFSSEDAMELVHCHIAREPTPLHVARPTIPRAISDVVAKLLAKTAEERYQSGHGLASDLTECLAALEGTGEIVGFVPGRHDVSSRFQLPQKLYGREAELEILLSTFDRVSRGKAELLLVAGQPGIGKSALVNEVQKPLVQRRGYFISGKFDQLKRDIPYASVIEAFQDLVGQILAESGARLASWRTKLEVALGDNGAVITEVIPAAELIIGKQPPVPALPPSESLNRWNLVFENFVRAFASAEHPLVIFLDDLQWADAPSLKLLQLLLTNADLRHVCVCGAYRDNEVSGAHPLLTMLAAIRAAGRPVTTLTLGPLDERDVAELLDDTVRCGPELAAPLAALLFQKTAGNPFFVGQLLGALHDDGLIELDVGQGIWRWDLDAIRDRGLTDNVVELMVGRLQKLPAEAQQALKLAACIGNRFDLAMLATVCRSTPAEAAPRLWPAVEEGLVIPLGDAHRTAHPSRFNDSAAGIPDASFKFLHDRVQQAAYSLIAEDRRQGIHLDIARLLLVDTEPSSLDDAVFDIVNQFEHGLEQIVEREERYAVAGLALLAGKKAKASSAYEPALRYLDLGLRLLPGDAFASHHELTFSLHVEGTEAAFLTVDFERAEALSDIAMAHAETLMERIRVLETRMLFQTARNRLEDTVRIGLTALELLGVTIPTAPAPADFAAALGKIHAALAGRQIEDLAELPIMRDEGMLAAMRIIHAINAPALATNPLQWLVMTCEYMNLCIVHGNSRFAPVAYAGMGAVHSGALGDVETANAYGRLALALQDKIGGRECRSSTIVLVHLFCTPWKLHLRDTIVGQKEGLQAGIESGDIEHGGYAIFAMSMALMMVGEPLDSVLEQLTRYMGWLTRFQQGFTRGFVSVFHQTALNLTGRAADPREVTGESFDAERAIPELLAAKNFASVYVLHICQTMVSYLLGEPERAVASAEAAEPYGAAQRGQAINALFYFYQALALLAVYPRASEAARPGHLAKADQNLVQLRSWASHAPQNYQHYVDLVEAERAWVMGDAAAAMDGYERAIRGAAQHGYVQDEALACERCADFCFARGWDRIGAAHLADAHYGYLRWGAAAKVEALEHAHASLSSSKARHRGHAPASLSMTESTSHPHAGSTLELGALMKAARAISGEIVLDRLIQALMRIMVESAGAQRGYLLLDKDGALVIEVEWSAERADVVPRRSAPLTSGEHLSAAIVNYAGRTGDSVVLADASAEGAFTRDPYVLAQRPRSILCAPLVNQGKLIAIVYLENNLAPGAFTADRLEALNLLSAQAALSIHNATLYATLEDKVEARTLELSDKNRDLAGALHDLKATQQQLVTQEKLASLGALTAGIAHELKNPLNFINNFAELSGELAGQLAEALNGQRDQLDPATLAEIDELLGSITQGVRKIDEHGKKANSIINGMLLHARDVPGQREVIDLNRVLAESVDLVQHGVRARVPDARLHIETDYDASLAPVEVAAQDIRRVFVNLLDNAWFAMLQKRSSAGAGYVPTLTVRTRSRGDRVEVLIRDNGTGVASEIADRIYHPFFTTKPAGQGTGLGLSLSHDIVVRGHGGELRMETQPGAYAEFIVSLPARAARG